jgi:hypothetical protein
LPLTTKRLRRDEESVTFKRRLIDHPVGEHARETLAASRKEDG